MANPHEIVRDIIGHNFGTQIVYQDIDGQIRKSSDGGYDILISGGNIKDKKGKYARLLAKLKKLDPKIKPASYSASKR